MLQALGAAHVAQIGVSKFFVGPGINPIHHDDPLPKCKERCPVPRHPAHRSTSFTSTKVLGKDMLVSGEIRLDTLAWFAWLEAETSISFSYPLFDPACGYIVGFMTVRKERKQRGHEYWSAYRRRNGRLRKRYLGASRSVTRARLEAIAAAFQSEGAAQRAAADLAQKEEERVQWQEPLPSPQMSSEEGRAMVLDVTREEPRNMDNAVARAAR
jgi:hypothetical protein